MVQMIITY